jgi:hypothetical protein
MMGTKHVPSQHIVQFIVISRHTQKKENKLNKTKSKLPYPIEFQFQIVPHKMQVNKLIKIYILILLLILPRLLISFHRLFTNDGIVLLVSLPKIPFPITVPHIFSKSKSLSLHHPCPRPPSTSPTKSVKVVLNMCIGYSWTWTVQVGYVLESNSVTWA